MQQKAAAEAEALKAELAGFREQLTQGAVTKEQLDTNVKQLQQQLDAARKDSESSKATVSRMSMIMKDFPDLAQFEALGLLPSGGDEADMRGKFEAFRQVMASMQSDTAKTAFAGASPDAGVGSQRSAETFTEEYILDQMMATVSNDKEFKLWQQRFDALQKK